MKIIGYFADEKNKCITTTMWIILFLARTFVFSWLIVGAVLFWRDIEPTGKCGKSVDSYIWARQIMKIIEFIIALKSENNNKNKK